MDIENTSLDCSIHTPEGVFYFRVSQDPSGRTSVSDLRRGSTYWTAAYPYEVHQAITEAINRLENLMANTSKSVDKPTKKLTYNNNLSLLLYLN